MSNFLNNIDYRVARTRQELELAYELVYKEYFKKGYINEDSFKLRLSIHNILPQATTFIAKVENSVVATATVIPNSPLGLPIDDMYTEEISLFRKHNKKFCEVIMLASNTELFRDGTSMMLNAKKMFFIFFLFKRIFDYAKNYLKLDYIFISVTPKHGLTYDYLHFTDIGPVKSYASINGTSGVGKCLKISSAEKDIQKEKSGLHKMFFSKKTDPEKFENKTILSLQDIKDIFIDKTNILPQATEEQLNYIKQCYPTYDFSEIIPSVSTI
ncbi:hypothetical protein MNBD_UNCLBAC01-831 [hydrothermal vent metagenome]|uniref:N-acyl amino acid synthase FeeM catalytic core domain-containing protein n=1 Tax=hydrothermal vent metagenome TaxID=652676 RepID=A0A3B1E184_9ZZZZ